MPNETENFRMLMSDEREQHLANARRRLDAIAGRMLAEGATIADLSDAEIERTLRPCVAGERLVEMAKTLRDEGDLEIAIARMTQDDD